MISKMSICFIKGRFYTSPKNNFITKEVNLSPNKKNFKLWNTVTSSFFERSLHFLEYRCSFKTFTNIQRINERSNAFVYRFGTNKHSNNAQILDRRNIIIWWKSVVFKSKIPFTRISQNTFRYVFTESKICYDSVF